MELLFLKGFGILHHLSPQLYFPKSTTMLVVVIIPSIASSSASHYSPSRGEDNFLLEEGGSQVCLRYATHRTASISVMPAV